MSSRFLLSLRKWPHAVQQALTFLNEASLYGETSCVDFIFGPPSIGRLPLQICIDGRKALLCELRDTNSSFLYEIRGWLERCLEHDFEGTYHPELLTLDCEGMVLSLVIVHLGWDDDSLVNEPVSFLAAIPLGDKEPAAYCFCYTIETVVAFYDALLRCFRRYRNLFNSPDFWYDVKRHDLLDTKTTYDRLMEQIRSKKVESYRRILHK